METFHSVILLLGSQATTFLRNSRSAWGRPQNLPQVLACPRAPYVSQNTMPHNLGALGWSQWLGWGVLFQLCHQLIWTSLGLSLLLWPIPFPFLPPSEANEAEKSHSSGKWVFSPKAPGQLLFLKSGSAKTCKGKTREAETMGRKGGR